MNTYEPLSVFMDDAINCAIESRHRGDYRIGAIIEIDGIVVSRGFNEVITGHDPTAHAEVMAIRTLCKQMGSRHINNGFLYTTAEPCPMCVSAAIWAKLRGIVFGTTIDDMAEFSVKNGSPLASWRTIALPARQVALLGEPKIEVYGPFSRDKCLKLFHE